ncbi:hypothetical protein [Peterkaempfera sp. SMS 1(5)a]|uniref:LppU/SCO3897 family protein n=1 Tax=Peterkaempfera podocarpi TaxID=3232308 RepID=UPI00366B097F
MTTPTPQQSRQAPDGTPFPSPSASADDSNAHRPRRKGGKPLILAVAILAVAAAAGFGIRYATADKPSHAAVGECIHATGAKNSPNVSTVPCTDGAADYTVVRVVEDSTRTGACNNLSDAALTQQSDGHSYVLCVNKKSP